MRIRERREDGTFGDFIEVPKTNLTLEQVKTLKIQELDKICNEEILSGFYSPCLGEENHYDFDMEAQTNMNGQLNFINAGLTKESDVIRWKANGRPKEHTVQQFKELCIDAFDFKQLRIGVYWTKKEQVLLSATENDVMSIV